MPIFALPLVSFLHTEREKVCFEPTLSLQLVYKYNCLWASNTYILYKSHTSYKKNRLSGLYIFFKQADQGSWSWEKLIVDWKQSDADNDVIMTMMTMMIIIIWQVWVSRMEMCKFMKMSWQVYGNFWMQVASRIIKVARIGDSVGETYVQVFIRGRIYLLPLSPFLS